MTNKEAALYLDVVRTKYARTIDPAMNAATDLAIAALKRQDIMTEWEKQELAKLAAKREAPKPTVGRIVHYMNLGDADGKYPPETQAAVITGVNADGTIALHIFYRTGLFNMDSVPFSEEPKRGHWNWPPRE